MTSQTLASLRLRLDEKRAFRVEEFCAAYGLGRTKTYELIKAGKLGTVLVGGRRLIPKDAAEALLAEPGDDR
jgi:excisionase family DNA binding protein